MESISLPDHRLVDLTLPLAEDLPCYWPTHMPFQHKTWNWFTTHRDQQAAVYNRNSAPYATRWMSIDEHTGTHFDAPSHFVAPPGSGIAGCGPAGEITAEKVPLESLMGPAAVIDVRDAVPGDGPGGVSPVFGPEAIGQWERKNGRLLPGDVVLFRTNWDQRYVRGPGGATYLHDIVVTKHIPGWPAPGESALTLLLDRGIRCMGTDAPSMGAAHDGATAHLCGLGQGAIFVECLTKLDSLPARGAWFCFLPLKVENGTGAPGRAIAMLPG
jgi:kynurenine formamidase